MQDKGAIHRRWWQMKKVWLIGLPVFLVVGIVGVFVWGSLQSKPKGFAPVDRSQVAAAPQLATAVDEKAESEPIEIVRYTLDATSRDEWVLFDFAEGRVVGGDLVSPGWDLAFRRTKVLTNSGVTNPSGPGGAADLGEILLEDVTLPASIVFAVDALGGDDEDEPENPAVGGWYSYSFIKHIVSTKPNTYLVRTGDDLNALIQFDSYYCENEDPGCITFRYRLVPSTGPTDS